MNSSENNYILIFMLFLIPFYLILITIFKEKVYQSTYPVAISMIGLSLLFMHSLTSFHIFGVDIHEEFYCYKLTLTNLHWSISLYPELYNSSLFITIFPTILYSLSNINPEYVFKLFFPLIAIISPLSVYVFSKRYFNNYYAFLASLLFIFQIPFIFSQQSSTKTMFAILFSNLAILVLFDKKLRNALKTTLFLVFTTMIIFSHYTSSYIFLVIILTIAFCSKIKNKFFNNGETNKKFLNSYFDINLSMCLLFSIILFLWYAQVTEVPFQSGIQFLQDTLGSFSNFFNMDMRADTQLAVVGIGLTKIPNIISVIVHDLIFLVIGLGLLTLIFGYKNYKSKFEFAYLIGATTSVCMLALFLLVPYLSKGYGGTRLFLFTLIFLAPLFIIGSKFLANNISRVIPRLKKLNIIIPVLLLISIFTCATYLQYSMFNAPYSPYYEKASPIREQIYISSEEYSTSIWLNSNTGDYKIRTDSLGYYRIELLKLNKYYMDPFYFDINETKKGYLYLTAANVNGKAYLVNGAVVPINRNIINNKNKIFDSGSNQVWF